ncbi:unnamed protein product [Linum trigynum]|uniref:Uncharacterized protein n=1 Tax=Linum trigynum TaxID=586398 RepID=A0AAV2DTR2_9ROSI
MKEERKKGGQVKLSDIYTSELKAGIHSPYKSSGTRSRIEEEPWCPSTDPEAWRDHYSSGGLIDGRETMVAAEFTSARREEEAQPQVPPGFTVLRLEEEARAEEGNNRWRMKGKYREDMGARNLELDLEEASAAMQGSLSLDGGKETQRQAGGYKWEPNCHLGLETLPHRPAQELTWSPGHSTLSPRAHTNTFKGSWKEIWAEIIKKRKGQSILSPGETGQRVNEGSGFTLSPSSSMFAGGVKGRSKKKKHQRNKAQSTSEDIGDGEESDTRAAVVRQKPPHDP